MVRISVPEQVAIQRSCPLQNLDGEERQDKLPRPAMKIRFVNVDQ